MNLSPRSQRFLLLFILISSLALTILIVSDWLPYLRGPAPETNEWYWPHTLRPLFRWWPSIIVAALFWLVAAWWLSPQKSDRRRNLIALIALFIASILLQLALIYADRPDIAAELVDRTLSNQASGFFEPAAEIESMSEVLRNYPQQMPQFASEHAQTHPPGLIFAHWLTIKGLSYWPTFSEYIAQSVRPLRCTDLWLLDRPPQVAAGLAVWSLLPILAAALIVAPAFGLAQLLLHGRAQRLAAILVAAVPALLLFAPKSVQIYALLAVILLWIFSGALVRRSLWRMLGAGILLSLMTTLSLGNAALYPILVLYALLLNHLTSSTENDIGFQSYKWSTLLLHLFLFTMAAISLWLLNWALWGIPPWAIARVGLAQHYELVTRLRRYDWWLTWNLLDWLIFSGWPMALGFLASLILALKTWHQKQQLPVDILALCLALFILILDISGSARGEVGRIWLFFMPLLAFPSAHFWTSSLPGRRHVWLIVALQLLIVATIGLSWRPVRAVIVVAQEPPMTLASPTASLDINFVDQPFSLLGFSLASQQVQPGDQIDLTLFWRADAPSQRPFTVFTHLTNGEGELVAQQDNWPVDGQWPPTCWRAGDSIVDNYLIPLPNSLPPGDYKLSTGLYDSANGLRLSIQEGDDAVHLATITVR